MDEGDEYVPQISQMDYSFMNDGSGGGSTSAYYDAQLQHPAMGGSSSTMTPIASPYGGAQPSLGIQQLQPSQNYYAQQQQQQQQQRQQQQQYLQQQQAIHQQQHGLLTPQQQQQRNYFMQQQQMAAMGGGQPPYGGGAPDATVAGLQQQQHTMINNHLMTTPGMPQQAGMKLMSNQQQPQGHTQPPGKAAKQKGQRKMSKKAAAAEAAAAAAAAAAKSSVSMNTIPGGFPSAQTLPATYQSGITGFPPQQPVAPGNPVAAATAYQQQHALAMQQHQQQMAAAYANNIYIQQQQHQQRWPPQNATAVAPPYAGQPPSQQQQQQPHPLPSSYQQQQQQQQPIPQPSPSSSSSGAGGGFAAQPPSAQQQTPYTINSASTSAAPSSLPPNPAMMQQQHPAAMPGAYYSTSAGMKSAAPPYYDQAHSSGGGIQQYGAPTPISHATSTISNAIASTTATAGTMTAPTAGRYLPYMTDQGAASVEPTSATNVYYAQQQQHHMQQQPQLAQGYAGNGVQFGSMAQNVRTPSSGGTETSSAHPTATASTSQQQQQKHPGIDQQHQLQVKTSSSTNLPPSAHLYDGVSASSSESVPWPTAAFYPHQQQQPNCSSGNGDAMISPQAPIQQSQAHVYSAQQMQQIHIEMQQLQADIYECGRQLQLCQQQQQRTPEFLKRVEQLQQRQSYSHTRYMQLKQQQAYLAAAAAQQQPLPTLAASQQQQMLYQQQQHQNYSQLQQQQQQQQHQMVGGPKQQQPLQQYATQLASPNSTTMRQLANGLPPPPMASAPKKEENSGSSSAPHHSAASGSTTSAPGGVGSIGGSGNGVHAPTSVSVMQTAANQVQVSITPESMGGGRTLISVYHQSYPADAVPTNSNSASNANVPGNNSNVGDSNNFVLNNVNGSTSTTANEYSNIPPEPMPPKRQQQLQSKSAETGSTAVTAHTSAANLSPPPVPTSTPSYSTLPLKTQPPPPSQFIQPTCKPFTDLASTSEPPSNVSSESTSAGPITEVVEVLKAEKKGAPEIDTPNLPISDSPAFPTMTTAFTTATTVKTTSTTPSTEAAAELRPTTTTTATTTPPPFEKCPVEESSSAELTSVLAESKEEEAQALAKIHNDNDENVLTSVADVPETSSIPELSALTSSENTSSAAPLAVEEPESDAAKCDAAEESSTTEAAKEEELTEDAFAVVREEDRIAEILDEEIEEPPEKSDDEDYKPVKKSKKSSKKAQKPVKKSTQQQPSAAINVISSSPTPDVVAEVSSIEESSGADTVLPIAAVSCSADEKGPKVEQPEVLSPSSIARKRTARSDNLEKRIKPKRKSITEDSNHSIKLEEVTTSVPESSDSDKEKQIEGTVEGKEELTNDVMEISVKDVIDKEEIEEAMDAVGNGEDVETEKSAEELMEVEEEEDAENDVDDEEHSQQASKSKGSRKSKSSKSRTSKSSKSSRRKSSSAAVTTTSRKRKRPTNDDPAAVDSVEDDDDEFVMDRKRKKNTLTASKTVDETNLDAFVEKRRSGRKKAEKSYKDREMDFEEEVEDETFTQELANESRNEKTNAREEWIVEKILGIRMAQRKIRRPRPKNEMSTTSGDAEVEKNSKELAAEKDKKDDEGATIEKNEKEVVKENVERKEKEEESTEKEGGSENLSEEGLTKEKDGKSANSAFEDERIDEVVVLHKTSEETVAEATSKSDIEGSAIVNEAKSDFDEKEEPKEQDDSSKSGATKNDDEPMDVDDGPAESKSGSGERSEVVVDEEKKTSTVENRNNAEEGKSSANDPIKEPTEEAKKEDEEEFDEVEEEAEQIYVKFKNRSYIHCEWKFLDELEQLDKRAVGKVNRYKQKYSYDGGVMDEDYFNEDYVIVHRVLDDMHDEDDENDYAFVKWRSLPYDECTWELFKDVPMAKIEESRTRNTDVDACKVKERSRPNLVEWEKIPSDKVFKDGNVLRDYQVEGVNWLLFCYFKKQNCILADEMGLGKTVQTITFLQGIYDLGIHGPFLIVVPLSTLHNWEREFETWTDMNVVVYHGSAASRQTIQDYELYYQKSDSSSKKKSVYKFDALITTFEMVVSDCETLRRINYRVCVIDEAHRLKNRNCKLLTGGLLSFKMEHRVLLTGTPLQNNIQELFSLLNFLEPDQFSNSESFLEQFGQCQTEEQVQKLQEILKPMMLRRLKEDVEKTLQPKEETIIEVQLSNIQKKYYRAILERNFTHLLKGTSAPSLMNTMMELRKCCNHPFLINGAEEQILNEMRQQNADKNEEELQLLGLVQSSGKMVLIDKLLPKLRADGHKVLIFSQMVRVLDILEEFLSNMNYPFERIDGNVRGDLRQAAIDRFSKQESERFVFLLCTRAGGLGINLTAADTVIIFDSDWNPQNDLQAQARCHRIGQKKMVKVYRLITANTYEREMFDKASLKLGLDKAVLQSMAPKENSQQLTRKEVEDLLRKGAYGAVMDEDNEGSKFSEEDIDTILQRRTQTIKLEPGVKGSTFAKASFTSSMNEDIDINDPNFWSKWAKKANIDVDLASNKAAGKLGADLIVLQPRSRRKRFEEKPTESVDEDGEAGSDGADSEDVNGSSASGGKSGKFSAGDTDSQKGVGRGGKKRRRRVGAAGADGDEDYVGGSRAPNELSINKSDLFKVEKLLNVWGWGRWEEIRQRVDLQRDIDVEHVARTLLLHSIRQFRGDEKTREFVWNLITPQRKDEVVAQNGESTEATAAETNDAEAAANSSTSAATTVNADGGLYREGWAVLPQYNPPSLAIDTSFHRHLHRRAKKFMERICHLYFLQHKVIGERGPDILAEKIGHTDFQLQLPVVGNSPLPDWDLQCDKSLLIGVYKHGVDNFEAMRTDQRLCFAERKVEFVPTGELETRFNRLITVLQRQAELTATAVATPRFVRWPRDEMADFMRVLLSYGVKDDSNTANVINWTQFRELSNLLQKKTDAEMLEQLYCVLAMCTRQQGGELSAIDQRRAACVEPITGKRAEKLMNRLHLMRKIHAIITTGIHNVRGSIKLCSTAAMPKDWSENHDEQLLIVVDKFGLDNIASRIALLSVFRKISGIEEKLLLRRVIEICTTIETGKWNGVASTELIEDDTSDKVSHNRASSGSPSPAVVRSGLSGRGRKKAIGVTRGGGESASSSPRATPSRAAAVVAGADGGGSGTANITNVTSLDMTKLEKEKMKSAFQQQQNFFKNMDPNYMLQLFGLAPPTTSTTTGGGKATSNTASSSKNNEAALLQQQMQAALLAMTSSFGANEAATAQLLASICGLSPSALLGVSSSGSSNASSQPSTSKTTANSGSNEVLNLSKRKTGNVTVGSLSSGISASAAMLSNKASGASRSSGLNSATTRNGAASITAPLMAAAKTSASSSNVVGAESSKPNTSSVSDLLGDLNKLSIADLLRISNIPPDTVIPMMHIDNESRLPTERLPKLKNLEQWMAAHPKYTLDVVTLALSTPMLASLVGSAAATPSPATPNARSTLNKVAVSSSAALNLQKSTASTSSLSTPVTSTDTKFAVPTSTLKVGSGGTNSSAQQSTSGGNRSASGSNGAKTSATSSSNRVKLEQTAIENAVPIGVFNRNTGAVLSIEKCPTLSTLTQWLDQNGDYNVQHTYATIVKSLVPKAYHNRLGGDISTTSSSATTSGGSNLTAAQQLSLANLNFSSASNALSSGSGMSAAALSQLLAAAASAVTTAASLSSSSASTTTTSVTTAQHQQNDNAGAAATNAATIASLLGGGGGGSSAANLMSLQNMEALQMQLLVQQLLLPPVSATTPPSQSLATTVTNSTLGGTSSSSSTNNIFGNNNSVSAAANNAAYAALMSAIGMPVSSNVSAASSSSAAAAATSLAASLGLLSSSSSNSSSSSQMQNDLAAAATAAALLGMTGINFGTTTTGSSGSSGGTSNLNNSSSAAQQTAALLSQALAAASASVPPQSSSGSSSKTSANTQQQQQQQQLAAVLGLPSGSLTSGNSGSAQLAQNALLAEAALTAEIMTNPTLLTSMLNPLSAASLGIGGGNGSGGGSSSSATDAGGANSSSNNISAAALAAMQPFFGGGSGSTNLTSSNGGLDAATMALAAAAFGLSSPADLASFAAAATAASSSSGEGRSESSSLSLPTSSNSATLPASSSSTSRKTDQHTFAVSHPKDPGLVSNNNNTSTPSSSNNATNRGGSRGDLLNAVVEKLANNNSNNSGGGIAATKNGGEASSGGSSNNNNNNSS